MAERIRTNDEIDILNKFLPEGQTPLPYEVSEQSQETFTAPILPKLEENKVTPELTEEQKAEQKQIEDDRIAAQKILDQNQKAVDKQIETEKNKIIAAEEQKVNVSEIIPQKELDDEAVIAYLKKTKGKEINSLDDFLNPVKELTAEEKIAEKEKRESNMFAHGLSTGAFTKKDLENFISDSKNPSELVYEAYANDQKAKDDTLTDAEIRDEFNEKMGLDIENKESRQYIAGQNLINKLATGLLKDKYPKIVNLDKEYSSFEATQKTQNDFNKKVATQKPIYQRDIEEIRNASKKINIAINDKENFEFVVDEGVLAEVEQEMLSDKIVNDNINKGYRKEDLKQLHNLTALMKSLPKIMNDYADKRELEKQAGLRGIQPAGKQTGRERVEVELTENQKKAIEMTKGLVIAN